EVVVPRDEPEAERLHEMDGIGRAQRVQQRIRILRREHCDEGVGHHSPPVARCRLVDFLEWTYSLALDPMSSQRISRGDRRKQQTRARILEAAVELFGEVGFDATKISDVCGRADVARQTFFN